MDNLLILIIQLFAYTVIVSFIASKRKTSQHKKLYTGLLIVAILLFGVDVIIRLYALYIE